MHEREEAEEKLKVDVWKKQNKETMHAYNKKKGDAEVAHSILLVVQLPLPNYYVL